jgi:heterodisulfide reductase subunit C2
MEKAVIGNKLNSDFKYEVAAFPGGENIKKCFACGTCTAGCPVFHVENQFNPRKIIRMILLGMREEVLNSKAIWFCIQCYTCSANCPQDVDFSDIMFSLQNLSVKEGFTPPDLRKKIEKVSIMTHEFRRDCLNVLMHQEDSTVEEIRKNMEELLKFVQENG